MHRVGRQALGYRALRTPVLCFVLSAVHTCCLAASADARCPTVAGHHGFSPKECTGDASKRKLQGGMQVLLLTDLASVLDIPAFIL